MQTHSKPSIFDRVLFDDQGKASFAGGLIFLLAAIGAVGILGTLLYLIGHGF